jgi:fructokinase
VQPPLAESRPLVVGIGEVLWDVYPDGAHLGGAPANFACHAAALGAESWIVSAVGAVGADDLGDRAVEQLGALGVRVDYIARDREHATGRVNVALDADKRPTFEIATDAAWDHIPWTRGMEALAARADAVCFGTLAQRSPGSRDTIARFLRATRPSALRMFDVNLRQHYHDRDTIERSLELASAVKLNEDELPVVASLCGIRAAGTPATLKALARQYGLRLAALTRGPDGAILVAGHEESSEPAPPVHVVDTVGAGDAFTAALVCDFLRGLPLAEVNRRANAVAAFVCSVAGATGRLPASLSAEFVSWRAEISR